MKRAKEFISNRGASFWVVLIILVVLIASVLYFKPIGGDVQVLSGQEDEETVSEFKILKQEGIRATNTIKGVVKNINGVGSAVTITAKLQFAGQVVAEQTVTLYDIKIFEEKEFEIVFDNPSTWNAFKLEIK